MEAKERTYGFVVETEIRHGTGYVSARVLCREGKDSHPLNCRHECESEIWDAPKRLDGYMLAGLELRGFRSDLEGEPFLGFAPEFYDTYSANLRTCEGMVRTLRKVHRQIEREDAREPGDVYMALARALGLSWFAWKRETNGAGFGYAASDWAFDPVERGRDELRRQIEATKRQNEAA